MRNWPKPDPMTDAPHGMVEGNDSIAVPGGAQKPKQKLRFFQPKPQFETRGTIQRALGKATVIGEEVYGSKGRK